MSDNTPDFDKMSPEELMKWMETLAKRQGAYEGFTTTADMDVAEVDPDSVVIDEPGYVPYGQENKKPEDVKPKPAAPAPAAVPTPPVVSPIPAAPPPPVVAPAAAAPAAAPAAASATPDFDSMSPEDIMKWMETLAKRQGAYEGFTTTADMNIADVDPDSVPNDEPGYVPFEGKAPKARPADAAPTPAPAPKPIPVAPPPPAMPVAPAATVQPVGQDALDWLEKLAADPGNELPALDFSGLGELADAPPLESENTLGWLEGLAHGGTVDLSSFETPAQATPAAAPVGDDPMAWLENLASKQGADEVIPSAEPEFSLDSILEQADEPAASIFPTSDDPAAWLDSLAEQRSGIPPQAPPPVVTSAPPAAAAAKAESAEIMSALNSGKEVDPNDIAAFFGNMMNIAANRDDVQDYTFDPEDEAEEEIEESEAIQSQIPDWLQAVAPVPQTDVPEVVPASLFVEDFVAPVMDDMPDWLKEEAVTDDSGLENIFASVSAVPDFSPPTTKVETPAVNVPSAVKEEFLNTDDQWIETFELEYRERVGDAAPEAPAAVASSVSAPSAASDLPEETELSEGEPVALPDWLLSAASAAPSEEGADAMPDWLAEPADQGVSLDWITDEPAPVVEEAVVSDLPDWLSEAAESTPDVPDWLLEPVEEPVAFVLPPAPVAAPAAPAIVPAPAPKPVPAPVPAPARQGFPAAAVDVSGVLGSAREKVAAGDVDNGLMDYESVVRAGGDLEEVIAELRSLMSRNPNNPAVYRVLGDALMRGGRLQEALDTYRKALNLL